MSQLDFKRGLCVATVLLGVQLALEVPCVMAQPLPSAQGTPSIRGFSITGVNPLADADISLALAPFLRQPATLENLQKASATLESLLRDKGFGLHRVVLPPQAVGEVIELQLVRFAIGQVRVEGASAFSEANIRASVPSLAEGEAPNLDTLAIQTAMANENPAKNTQVALRAAQVPDVIDASVKVTDSPPLKFSASLSNTGSRETGRDRFTVSAGHHNVFGQDHQLLVAATTSLADPSKVRQLGLNYRLPLYGHLTTLEVAYTDSNVVGSFGTFTSSGAGQTLGLTATRHLQAPQGRKRQVFVSWEDKTFEPTSISGVVIAGQQTRRTRPLTLGYAIKAQNTAQTWDGSVALVTNLSGGSGNHLAAYQSESPSVTRRGWSALRVQGNGSQSMGDGWVIGVRGRAQWAPDALIAGEQLGVGGYTSLRGVQERALAGDSGLLATLEAVSPEWQPGLRWVGFVDGGWVRNHRLAGSPLPLQDSAISVGLGLRYGTGNVSVALDYGRVVKGSNTPLTLNTSSPQSGDHKLHFLLFARY